MHKNAGALRVEASDPPGTGVTCVCETPGMGAGSQTGVLWKAATSLNHWVIALSLLSIFLKTGFSYQA